MKTILQKFNYEVMETVFNAPFEWFEQFGEVRTGTTGRRHIFIDNGADILAVAHLDTVNSDTHFYVLPKLGKQNLTVMSTRCDDRLGVWMILCLLPLYGGMNYDILLTEDEEIGKSTARDFVPSKEYNWGFEIDRRLDDCVTYGYSDKEWDRLLKNFFKMGKGSVSDISYLEDVGCKMFNLGAGYEDEHDITARFYPEMAASQAGKFLNFYFKNRYNKFPHEKAIPKTYTSYASPYAAVPVTRPWYCVDDDKEETPPKTTTTVQPSDIWKDGHLYPDRFPTKCMFCGTKFSMECPRSDDYLSVCQWCEQSVVPCVLCGIPMHSTDFITEELECLMAMTPENEELFDICDACQEEYEAGLEASNEDIPVDSGLDSSVG